MKRNSPAPTDSAKAIETLLKGAGFKTTPFRLELLTLLKKRSRPMSAAEIQDALKGPGFDRVTLFRNLQTMAKKGLLEATEFGTGATYYCIGGTRHHHHFFCLKCKKVSGIDSCSVEPTIKAAQKGGYVVQNHKLELFGLCPSCAKRG